MNNTDSYEPIINAAWEWSAERLGEEKVRELTGGFKATRETARIAYDAALAVQSETPTHWYVWSETSTRDWSARALVEKVLGADNAKGSLPISIAEAGLSLVDEK